MASARFVAAVVVVAMAPWLGCAKQRTVARAQPSSVAAAPAVAPGPAPPTMGQTELQATPPPQSTSEAAAGQTPLAPTQPPAADAVIAVEPDGTKLTAAQIVAHGAAGHAGPAPADTLDAGDEPEPLAPPTLDAAAPADGRN